MAHLVFATQALADAFGAAINADFGYPLPNVVCPGGAPAPRGNTTRYAATLKHPTLSRWAYPYEPVIAGQSGRVPPGRAPEELDATWTGATSN
jgi:hypothetical protein